MFRKLFGLAEEAPEVKEEATEDAVVQLEEDPAVEEAKALDDLQEAASKAAAEEAAKQAAEEAAKQIAEEAAKQAEEKAAKEREAEISAGKEKAEDKPAAATLPQPQQAIIEHAPTLQSVTDHLRKNLMTTSASIQNFLHLYAQEFSKTSKRAHKKSEELAHTLNVAANDMVKKESLRAKEVADTAINGFVDRRLGTVKEARYRFSPTLSLLNRTGLLPNHVEEHPRLESYFRLKR